MRAPALDFDRRPILVFWESTRACGLACRHCRAEAMPHPAPGELDHEQSLAFIESLREFGRPAPVLIVTGGDALMRPDLPELVAHARSNRIPVALAPSVTPSGSPGCARSVSRSPRSRWTAHGPPPTRGSAASRRTSRPRSPRSAASARTASSCR